MNMKTVLRCSIPEKGANGATGPEYEANPDPSENQKKVHKILEDMAYDDKEGNFFSKAVRNP
jgi:hypothetical protein